MQAEFVVDNPENIVEMEFWYTSGKDSALDFLKSFGTQITPIINDLDFSPHVVTWSCTYCDSDYKKKNCLGDGKYCGLRTDKTSIRSKDLVLEDLREVCIHQLATEKGYPQLYWDYISEVHEQCYNYISKSCSKRAVETLNLLTFDEVDQCVKDSFEGGEISLTAENTILKEDSKRWLEYGSAYSPAVVINNLTFRGTMNSNNVYEAVCASYSSMPRGCVDYQGVI